jgi:hypothetical protein
MVLDELIHQLKSLSSLGKGFKPHKYLALLTLVHLIRDGHIEDGKIFYNDLFKEYFKKNFDVFADSDDRNRPYNPFFHLRSSGFWILVATDGNKDALDGLNSIGGPGELTRLVSHAQIDSELVEELQNESARERLESAVAEILQQRKYRKLGSNGSNRVISESTSLYAHEDYAIRRIDDAVKVNNLGYICSNLDIHDPQSNRYFEIDILIISQFGIYVVELKHWTGNIHVKPNMWLVNGFSRPDPHKGNNHKAKLIRGLCTRKFPYFKWPYVESIVTLTHPDAVVMGSSLPNTSDNNPTFDSINHLIDYLKRQRRDKEATLSSLECKNIASFIMSLHGVGEHPNILRVWSIPNEYGYIVEGSDWSEQGTLRNAIDTQAPFDMEKALTITRGILHGLQAIHEIGVIHRSLSPENILLVEDIPKLMNFDLSYQIADDRMTVIPDPSKLKRQPYIAPEIYQNADSLSESADIFSVGVLLYEMLTGEGPFKCSTDLAQTNGRLSERCLDKLRENNIPDSAISLINGLVQLTDTARPATVSDILQRLDKHVTQPVPAATNPQLKPGDSYNLYEIVEFLGKGAESQT